MFIEVNASTHNDSLFNSSIFNDDDFFTPFSGLGNRHGLGGAFRYDLFDKIVFCLFVSRVLLHIKRTAN